jgi:hypothetical protein
MGSGRNVRILLRRWQLILLPLMLGSVTGIFLSQRMAAPSQPASSIQTAPLPRDASFDNQLRDAERRLVEQERKLEAYARQHSGQLVAQIEEPLQRIQKQQAQLQMVRESIHKARELRLRTERELGNAIQQGSEPSGTTLDGSEPGDQRTRELQSELATIDRDIDSARARETRLKRTIARDHTRLREVPAAGSAADAELLGLVREYGVLRDAYSALVAQREDVNRATGVEDLPDDASAGAVDPMSGRTPGNQEPRLWVLAGGVLGGLAFGLALVRFAEHRNSTFRTEADLAAALAFPVLSVVPLISDEPMGTREGEPDVRKV